jgi:hypothetical protein
MADETGVLIAEIVSPMIARVYEADNFHTATVAKTGFA